MSEPRDPSEVRPGTLTSLLEELVRDRRRGPDADEERTIQAGTVVGRFEIVREIARGGFGVVYEARDRELGRRVAFKVLRVHGEREVVEERLFNEAEAAARLSHPNVVTLYDLGRSEYGPYLVLELLKGETLAQRLAHGPVPLREALRIGHEIAKGLAHAHSHGVVHRDLTPGNVFLCDDGQVKLLDLGMAYAFGHRKTEGGTPACMAPEQRRGAPEDERTDVFALGVLLYRMLAGDFPFPEIGTRPPGRQLPPALEVPDEPGLGDLVARMLAFDPVERPRDAGEVLPTLAAFRTELERAPLRDQAVRVRRRAPWRLASLVFTIVFIGAVAAYFAVARHARVAEPVARDRISVLVADFANQSGDPDLDGLSGMLITSLEQSRRLAVLTRARMLDILRQSGHPKVELVDESLGREVAQRAGVKAVLLASVRRLDDVYTIDLKVLDPASDTYLFTAKEDGRAKASIPGLIDRLSERTLERLTDRRGGAETVRVAAAVTSSLEAYQHYFRGQQLEAQRDDDAAMDEYRHAVAVDPGFAAAHYAIAYLGESNGLDLAARRDAIQAALRNIDRAPEKERLLIRAWKEHMEGHSDEARALRLRAADTYPEDKDVLFATGDGLAYEGRDLEALPYFERAWTLDPGWPQLLGAIEPIFAGAGRAGDLVKLAQRLATTAPVGRSYVALGTALGAAGKLSEAEAAFRRAVELDAGREARERWAKVMFLLERYQEAESILRTAQPSYRLAEALAYQGRRREALRVIDAMPRERRVDAAFYHAYRMVHLLGDEDRDAVHREAEALRRSNFGTWRGPVILAFAGESEAAAEQLAQLPRSFVHWRMVEALTAWRRGRPEASRLLAELAACPSYDFAAFASLGLGEIAFGRGRYAEAVKWLERYRTAGIPWTIAGMGNYQRSWAYPRSLYLLGLAHERLGHREEALAITEHLLALWKNADPSAPLLTSARGLRGRLAVKPTVERAQR